MKIKSLLLVALLMAGCTQPAPSGPTPGGKQPDTAVKTAHPQKKDLRRVIEQPATIEAFEETPLVAHIPGYVAKVPADIGTIVNGPSKGKPGEVLAELSVPEMLAELEQKKALVVQAGAEVKQAAASLDAAEAVILTAKAQVREAESSRARALASYEYWKGQYQRIADAVDKQVIEKQVKEETLNKYKASEAYRDEIEAKVLSAKALQKESEAKRNKASADVEASKARVLVAQAEEKRLAALAEYRFIRAPFDGVVTRRNIHTGFFLQPGAGMSNVLFVVARTDKLRIVADIPEMDAGFITNDLTAKIQPAILKDQQFEAKIARTSWTLDSRSRTLRVEFDYANKEGKLRPGMYANLTIAVKFADRWTIPASAIYTHADQPCCWRKDEKGKAVRTPLKLGLREGANVEVTKMEINSAWEAVTGNEEIVVSNLGAVSEGKDINK
jgi:HlyD family secretion protein